MTEPKLIVQPTMKPTRKMAAVIVAGAASGAIMAAVQLFVPWLPVAETAAVVDAAVVALVMTAAGYWTRERA